MIVKLTFKKEKLTYVFYSISLQNLISSLCKYGLFYLFIFLYADYDFIFTFNIFIEK